MGQLSPVLATRPGHPCASTILVAILVQEWPKVIVGTHCCTTVALDHISATMTCMMWHEEHLLNVSVLWRVHLSNLVLCVMIFQRKSRLLPAAFMLTTDPHVVVIFLHQHSWYDLLTGTVFSYLLRIVWELPPKLLTSSAVVSTVWWQSDWTTSFTCCTLSLFCNAAACPPCCWSSGDSWPFLNWWLDWTLCVYHILSEICNCSVWCRWFSKLQA
jgi:hypothetical protein